MTARGIDKNLPGIAPVAVGDVNGIAGCRIVVRDAGAIRRPRRHDRTLEKQPRRTAHRGDQP